MQIWIPPTGKLAVTQAAYVQQNSGENWDDVALTLSTLQPSAAVTSLLYFPAGGLIISSQFP